MNMPSHIDVSHTRIRNAAMPQTLVHSASVLYPGNENAASRDQR